MQPVNEIRFQRKCPMRTLFSCISAQRRTVIASLPGTRFRQFLRAAAARAPVLRPRPSHDAALPAQTLQLPAQAFHLLTQARHAPLSAAFSCCISPDIFRHSRRRSPTRPAFSSSPAVAALMRSATVFPARSSALTLHQSQRVLLRPPVPDRPASASSSTAVPFFGSTRNVRCCLPAVRHAPGLAFSFDSAAFCRSISARFDAIKLPLIPQHPAQAGEQQS